MASEANLPIEEIRSRFEQCLAASNRLVLTAETGAGKSTRVPAWLADRYDGLILVVEPRRVACTALADFLSTQRGEAVGGYFGHRVRFDDRSGPTTRVLYCTPGVALRILAGPAALGAIVVDEFHERSWQMDLVVTAVASLARFDDVPLVLTSATIDADAAAAPLGATTLHASGRTFPVEITYDESVLQPSVDAIGPRVCAAIDRALATHDGDVLVFLPGMREIRLAERALGRRDEEALIVHGSQPPEAMRRVFSTSKRRRIYLSTNVAETSLTLPGVRVVIDSGLAKTRLHRAGRAVLATVPISAASMEQRAGRAGRVAAGACVRLWSERFLPEAYQRPEIERVELDDLLLQAAGLGLSDSAFESATWVTDPPEFAVRRAAQRLAALAAIDGGGLTERGRRLGQLPVAAEEAALLVDAPPTIDGTLCDLVALLQARGSLLRNLDELDAAARMRAHDARIELLTGVRDEVTMNLRLLRHGEARTHHLSQRRLQDARAIARQLRDLVRATGAATEGLAQFIVSRLPAAGFVKRPRASKARGRSTPWANGSIEVSVYPHEPVDPEAEPWKSDAAVILETDWLSSPKGVYGVGRMVLPTEPAVLAAAGLGEVTVAEVTLEKQPRGGVSISAVRKVQLAGVDLASRADELHGAELHRAVAQLVFENRLFKGAGESIHDALHGWHVLAHWQGEPLEEFQREERPPPADAVVWLTGKLATLGLETAADLELLGATDLIPDLEVETGVPAWAAEPLLSAFPRLLMCRGGTYGCTVMHRTRTVQLEPVDAKARKLKEPPVSALPRFFGFSVCYLQGSRRLVLRSSSTRR